MKFIVGICFFMMGCSSFTGNLRKDLDDRPPYAEPTVGGAWPEGGQLESVGGVGHSDRSPASAEMGERAGRWVTDEQREANLRDQARSRVSNAASFSNNPNLPPSTKRLYKNGARATRDDFVDDAQNEGSLWASDGQTNYFFTKNKVKGPGDILTLTIEDGLVNDAGMELKRSLSEKEFDVEMEAAQTRLNDKAKSGKKSTSTGSTGAGAAGAQAKVEEEPEVPKATPADVDVRPTMELKANDTMYLEIVERYPNGNYRVQGIKRIPYRGGMRTMTLSGIAKGADVDEQETIQSGKLYEYRLKVLR